MSATFFFERVLADRLLFLILVKIQRSRGGDSATDYSGDEPNVTVSHSKAKRKSHEPSLACPSSRPCVVARICVVDGTLYIIESTDLPENKCRL
jgi:hypothetical protein